MPLTHSDNSSLVHKQSEVLSVENAPIRITRRTSCLGGPNITDPDDCFIYLVDLESHKVLIDAGLGRSTDRILSNLNQLGLQNHSIDLIVLTHEHADHVGGAAPLRDRCKAKIAAHEKAIPAIRQGNPKATAADMYGITIPPTPVDISLTGDAGSVPVGDGRLHFLHTPGHTPGSIVLYYRDGDRRVLFGQDLHGPFNRAWGSSIKQWRTSLNLVLALEADILCEGHMGV